MQDIEQDIRENIQAWEEWMNEVDRLGAKLLRIRGGSDQKRKIRKALNLAAELAGEAASNAERQLS